MIVRRWFFWDDQTNQNFPRNLRLATAGKHSSFPPLILTLLFNRRKLTGDDFDGEGLKLLVFELFNGFDGEALGYEISG